MTKMPGRYYITKQVAKGPVSELFLALDATDKSGKVTEFHLVRYRGEYCSKEGFITSLEAEASVELQLQHPAVLKLVDYGTWEGRSFVVYEKNPSLSLAEALTLTRNSGKAIDVFHVAGLAVQLLEALVYVHSIGEGSGGKKPPVFQSGFSPECVEISSSGQVKVRGFARSASQMGSRPNFLDMALGRMPYLSPAIWAGQRASPYTDLYSLGTLLWELFVGQPLSKGDAAGESAPPVFSLRPDIPRELDAFVAKLLAPDSDQGFASANEAKVALEKALFTLNAKLGKKDLALWHKNLRKLDSRAGLKEVHEGTGGERNVIAEVVANRKLKVLEASAPEEAEKDAAPAATAVKEAGPASNAWDKSVTFKEAPDLEAQELAEKTAKKRKLFMRAAAVLGVLVALAGGIFFFTGGEPELLVGVPEPVIPKPSKPRELLAVFAFQHNGSISVQGVRNDNKKSFAHGCGEVGRPCLCEFLVAPDDAEAAATTEGIFSPRNNLVVCPEAAGHKFVRVASKGEGAKSSNAVLIRGSLSWQQTLGPDLQKSRVRWVSQFTCDRTFFEGEGAGAKGELSCPPSQKLSTLSAVFHYYSFQSIEDGDQFAAPIPIDTEAACGNSTLSHYRCLDNTRKVLFGLYKKEEPPFTVALSLTRGPVGENQISVYGFAAEADSNGLCPVGLVKLRQWTAAPPAILGSTFNNDNGELNNRVFEQQEPKPFTISRQRNRSPCDGKGDCSFATFEDSAQAQATPYSAGGELCVFPPELQTAPDGGDEKVPALVKEKQSETQIQVKTSIPGYEVTVNGQKVDVKNNSFAARMNAELKVEVLKQGYLTQRFTIPPQEKGMPPYQIEAPAVTVVLGGIDLSTFPSSTATFFMGDDKIFSGPTPVNEKLPVGKYRVKLVDKTGVENEIQVVIEEGKNITVDHLMKKKEP